MHSLLRLCFNDKFCTLSSGSVLGLFIGFLCPLCVPASAAFFAAIGLTFIPHPTFIYPLIAVCSVVMFYGLLQGLKRHGDLSPFLFGMLGMFALPIGRYVIGSPVLTYTGAFCIITATIWNFLLQRQDAREATAPAAVSPAIA